jgi:hypothetical protein
MRTVLLIGFTLTLAACGGTESTEVNEVVKQSVDALRNKERVVVQVRLEKSELPSDADLAERRRLEEEIEVGRIGRIITTGAGVGYYDITVEVDSSADDGPAVDVPATAPEVAPNVALAEFFQGFVKHQPRIFWDSLPAGYRRSANTLVSGAGSHACARSRGRSRTAKRRIGARTRPAMPMAMKAARQSIAAAI